MVQTEIQVRLKRPHLKQIEFIDSPAKRKIVRAGRRGGKTTGLAIDAVEKFLKGRRVLYACPTKSQTDTFWFEIKQALVEPIQAGFFVKNETERYVERPGSKQRIKARTAFNADSLRGDYADYLIFDEYQDMDESAWNEVGAPMLLDNDGDAVFIYTSKIGLPHVKELAEKCQTQPERWQLFVFSSFDNPYISRSAIEEIAHDMTDLAYRLEIMAEEIDDDPNALWNRSMIDHVTLSPSLHRIVIGIDPPGGKTEAGIIVAGVAFVGGEEHVFVLADYSAVLSAPEWAAKGISAYQEYLADSIVAEVNYGGDMVANTIATINPNIPVEIVRASRGKQQRAEPVVALYQNYRGLHRVHHVGEFPGLEQEMCSWVPGVSKWSPNRIDALVWACFALVVDAAPALSEGDNPMAGYRG